MIGFVVPTVGRWAAVDALLGSLDRALATNNSAAEVVVVVQGGAEQPGAPAGPTQGWRRSYPHVRLTFVADDGWGASRARNVGLQHLPDQVTHAVWPNDHSTYTAASLAALETHLPAADLVVGRLVEGSTDRYAISASSHGITLTNVWDAIEPVTAISTALAREFGGWSENLGTGASSPWQSSALADLLLSIGASASVVWDPAFTAESPGFIRGASGDELKAKARSYGRGYGRVLSRWHYPWTRRIGSVVKPVLQPGYRVGPDVLPYGARISASVGRAEGVTGHLVPRSGRSLRRHEDIVRH